MTTVSASAKIILFGEHAVVYGIPAIAIPLPQLRSFATIQSAQTGFQIVAKDTQETLTVKDASHPLIQASHLTAKALDKDLPEISISLWSDIPMSSGFGSGASVTTAIVKSIWQYNNLEYDYTKINSLVFNIEKFHHGTPSGIDNTVIVYERPIYYTKGQPLEFISNKARLYFVIGDTGIPASTKITVSHVRKLYDTQHNYTETILDNIKRITEDARGAIEQGNVQKIGTLMTQNHTELQKLDVSIPQLDNLVEAALDAGAHGAKLSGGGGGGNMIALTDQENQDAVRKALENAGADQTFIATLEPQHK